MQNIRTDLAVEAHEMSKREAKNSASVDGVISDVEKKGDITVTRVKITNDNGSRTLGKAKGTYITIDAPNLKYSLETYERACSVIAEEIRGLTKIDSDTLTLVVGLGNREITPDALGSSVVSKLLITHHIKECSDNEIFGENP